ncbi:hypothetical protein [Saccharomonospora iraqiensis]|uniref:hypothetical protein n=1 Tax=Saccharomonospora iraqiensis TaxID=52698 RepID=UPI0003FE5341|nr:hypothetical protein [Saccharomonospora iraqiensis]
MRETAAADRGSGQEATEDSPALREWEKRRRGRCVRLWLGTVRVRAVAHDVEEARYRLTRYVRIPCHRTGYVPALRATDTPRPLPAEEWPEGEDYPREAEARWYDRAPHGRLERAHAAGYVRALTAARCRALGITVPAVSRESVRAQRRGASRTPGDGLSGWTVSHRVLFLAGPGEAPARARELAATVVDDAGRTAGEVVGLRADDGAEASGGRYLHPAETVTDEAITALWDDYDAAEDDPGEPAALARVLGLAAVHTWRRFRAGAGCRFGERNTID